MRLLFVMLSVKVSMPSIMIPDSFPNLPSAIQKMQQLFAMEEVNTPLLVHLLQEEPLLSANILKLVNSTHYGLKTKVTSISHAVTLLGTTVIRGIIMATVLKKSFPLDLSPYKISIEMFDAICILRVRLLHEWLKDEKLDLKTLSSAVFLMESGKIVTANQILKSRLSENFIDLAKHNTITKAEKILFRADSYQIASALFKKWQFDDDFTELIYGISTPQNYPQQILHILCVAIGIEGILDEANTEDALRLLKLYEIDEKNFLLAAQKIKKEIA